MRRTLTHRCRLVACHPLVINDTAATTLTFREGRVVSLALEQGYSDLTMTAVAERANVGQSTFYRHYQNLDDLLVQIFLTMIRQLIRRINQQETLADEALVIFTSSFTAPSPQRSSTARIGLNSIPRSSAKAKSLPTRPPYIP